MLGEYVGWLVEPDATWEFGISFPFEVIRLNKLPFAFEGGLAPNVSELLLCCKAHCKMICL